MFSLQSVTAWHNFMIFNDEYEYVAMSLGASPDEVFGPDWWHPVRGWLSREAKCVPKCGALRGILRGDLDVTWALTVRTLMRHVFALSGAPLLLIIR